MKYFGIALAVFVALVIAWFILNPNNSSDYVVMVQDDLSALEAELIEVEAAAQAGTLTPVEASAARTRIINRINAIEASAAASGRAELTVGQRAELNDALSRLKNILITYQGTLSTVEITAAADSRTPSSGSGRSGQSLASAIADVIDSVEDVVAQVVEEYELDVETDATIDAIVAEEEAKYASSTDDMNEDDTMNDSDDDMSDDTMTDDDGTGDSATDDSEDTSDDTETTNDDSSSDDTMTDDEISSTTVEANASLELETTTN